MLNFEKNDQKNQPLLREERILIKEDKYSLRIMLCLMFDGDPEVMTKDNKNSELKEQKEYPHKEYLYREKEKGTHIIHVCPNDFDERRLKSDSEIQVKYEIFRQVDDTSKIKIFGHGSKNLNYRALWSEYHYLYHADEIASIFELIQNPLVRPNWATFSKSKNLPAQYLRVSIIACHGANFASQLAGSLHLTTDKQRRWVLSITGGERGKVLRLNPKKSYRNEDSCYIKINRINRLLSFVSAIATIILPPLAAFDDSNNPYLFYGAFCAGGMSFLNSTVLSLEMLHDWLEKRKDLNGNSRHKIVFYTNFKGNSNRFYFNFANKDYFKKLYSSENIDTVGQNNNPLSLQ